MTWPARLPDPVPIPICPLCIGEIHPGEDTAKINGAIYHAGCAEDYELSEAKEGPQ